jgi:hypothetical protein
MEDIQRSLLATSSALIQELGRYIAARPNVEDAIAMAAKTALSAAECAVAAEKAAAHASYALRIACADAIAARGPMTGYCPNLESVREGIHRSREESDEFDHSLLWGEFVTGPKILAAAERVAAAAKAAAHRNFRLKLAGTDVHIAQGPTTGNYDTLEPLRVEIQRGREAFDELKAAEAALDELVQLGPM